VKGPNQEKKPIHTAKCLLGCLTAYQIGSYLFYASFSFILSVNDYQSCVCLLCKQIRTFIEQKRKGHLFRQVHSIQNRKDCVPFLALCLDLGTNSHILLSGKRSGEYQHRSPSLSLPFLRRYQGKWATNYESV
jgi:hypothetical protein